MKPEYDLLSFHIMEKFNNNLLFSWTYPSITDSMRSYLRVNCLCDNQQRVDFKYHRLEKHWIYIWERFKEQKTYALMVVTKSFNPQKYQQFGQHLCNIYEVNYKPIELVQVFLGAFTNGFYVVQQNGSIHQICFNKSSTSKNENFEVLVNAFDVEIILIFNALLLKKRIFVYHADYSCLLKHIEVMTQLLHVDVRNPTEYLFPCVKNIAMELQGRNFFLAGVVDKNINIKPDAYDLFVNLETSTIKISPNSKDIFQMTKWHKEIANLLTSVDVPDKTPELYKQTSDLLANLTSFAMASPAADGEPPMVTLDALRARKLPPAMENFFFNLALAENIMML